MKRFALLISLAVAACTEPVDKAAKQRIFSPEDPPQALAAAKQKLPPEEVAENVAVSRRVLGMGAAEATERIGAHKFTATVTYEWSAVGRPNLKLVENRTLLAGPGGLSGDFSGVEENSRDQGLEVMRVHGQVFAKSRYGKFRQRLRDRGIAEHMREELYGAISDFDYFFKGRIKLAAQGTVSHEGRTAWKYQVSLGPVVPDAGGKALPPPLTPKNGVDETTQRRLRFQELRNPRTLQGEVWVDAQTSVVVKTHLDGRIGVNADGGEAELRLVLDSSMTDIGKDPQLKLPADFLPDQDKPEGIAAALERFGIVRDGADGGHARAPDADDDDDDEAPLKKP